MAGLTGYSQAASGMRTGLRAYQRKIDQITDNALLEAGIAAQAAMVQTIWTTPSSLSPGKPNRVWTSLMVQSVSEPKVARRGQQRSLEAGWLDEQQDYFILQEDGGAGPHGVTIEPMHMLLRGYDAAEKILDQYLLPGGTA